jgi:hypothetical protein
MVQGRGLSLPLTVFNFMWCRSDQAVVRSPLCGQWDVERDHQLILSGTDRNIIGSCYQPHFSGTHRNLPDVLDSCKLGITAIRLQDTTENACTSESVRKRQHILFSL